MASFTINVTAANATRLQNALTESLDMEEPATLADLKDYVIQDLKQLCRSSEQRVAAAAAQPTDYPDIT